MSTPDERMTALCLTVPYLVDRAGFGRGWDTSIAFPASGVDEDGGELHAHPGEYPTPWAWCHSSAAVEAVRFVRHVWNSEHRPPSLAFWDDRHRAAYLEWAARPWWC